MILVIRPDASLEQIDHVIERVRELGFTPHVSRGESRTIVGVIGDETKPGAENFSAIPGVEQRVWFMPTRTGEWEIACSQLCGLGHYRMRGFYTIQTQADFDAWLRDQAAQNQP